MTFAQPLLPNLQGAGDRRFVVQQGVQIATLAEVYDLFAVAFDPIRLRGKDQGPLALAREFPCRKQGKMRVLARIGLLLFSTRRFLQNKSVEERTGIVEVELEQCVLASPSEVAEPLARRAPIGTHSLARFVGANPGGEIIQLVTARQDGGKTDDPAVRRIGAPK